MFDTAKKPHDFRALHILNSSTLYLITVALKLPSDPARGKSSSRRFSLFVHVGRCPSYDNDSYAGLLGSKY